jgi:hypothetical protein
LKNIIDVRIATDPMSLNSIKLFRSGNRILFTHSGDHEQVPRRWGAVMRKPFILLLGLFLGSHVPTAAQTPAPWTVPAQEHVAPTITILPSVSIPLPAPPFLSQGPEKSNAHFSRMFAGAYEPDYTLENFLSVNEVKTLTLTQSSLPLVQLWGGHLQLHAFHSTLHIQDALLNPFDTGSMRRSGLPRQAYLGGPPSIDLSGLSLGLHFSKNARTGNLAQSWWRLSRIVSSVLN